MKKLLLPALLSVAALGCAAAPSFAGTFGLIPHTWGLGCNKCATCCIRPYNAFTPVCCGGEVVDCHHKKHGCKHKCVDGSGNFINFNNPCNNAGCDGMVSQMPGGEGVMESAQAMPAVPVQAPVAMPTGFYPGYNYGFAPNLPANSMPYVWNPAAPMNGR
jgi:hypothetical protein